MTCLIRTVNDPCHDRRPLSLLFMAWAWEQTVCPYPPHLKGEKCFSTAEKKAARGKGRSWCNLSSGVWSLALGRGGFKRVCTLVLKGNPSFVIIKAPTPMTSDKNVYLLLPISSLQKEVTSTEKHFKGFSSSLFFP